MIDLRSRHLKVSKELRQTPRLEIRCKVLFSNQKGTLNLTDFSLTGFFVEVVDKTGFELGRVESVAIKFPNHEKAILLKAQIVNINKRGIGCQFLDLTSKSFTVIKNCFETFKNTLPIR